MKYTQYATTGKLITIDYNLLTICDFSYTINWLFISYIDLIAYFEKDSNLSAMDSTLLQLYCAFNTENRYYIYIDNAFSNGVLFCEFQKMSIGAVHTTRINSAELSDLIKEKEINV